LVQIFINNDDNYSYISCMCYTQHLTKRVVIITNCLRHWQ